MINKEMLVQLHKTLSLLQQALFMGGVPQGVDPDKVRAITEVQEIIEKMIEFMKRQKL